MAGAMGFLTLQTRKLLDERCGNCPSSPASGRYRRILTQAVRLQSGLLTLMPYKHFVMTSPKVHSDAHDRVSFPKTRDTCLCKCRHISRLHVSHVLETKENELDFPAPLPPGPAAWSGAEQGGDELGRQVSAGDTFQAYFPQ